MIPKPQAEIVQAQIVLAVILLTASCATGHQSRSSAEASSDDVVTITNSCGVMDPVRFVGRVVSRAPDGTLAVLADVTITRSRDAGYLTAGFEAQKYRADRRGRFDIPVVRGVESIRVGDGKESETIEDVAFTFEVRGCEALRWHPALDEQPVVIEMNCNNRPDGG